ncbi:MAG: thioredoxin family protein, partial [Bacteroidales bacterium]|nr:thioredoxin family protein [Bacteroidales bacterium]
GKELARTYGVKAYPTMLFLNQKGEVLHRLKGAYPADVLMKEARQVIKSINDPNSFYAMQKVYPLKKDDEAFLRKYIAKEKAMKQKPYKAIEDYLKVQTKMKENYSEMMEFIIANQTSLICGGESERIIHENYSEYYDIATQREEQQLERLRKQMIKNTRDYALCKKDAELYRLYMQRWNEDNPNPDDLINNDYWTLELLDMEGQSKAYRKHAREYLDELVRTQTVEVLHAKDKAEYEAMSKKFEGQKGNMFNANRLERARTTNADRVIAILHNVCQSYLKTCKSKNDYKATTRWIDYGQQLKPQDYRMLSFEADVLFAQKKYSEAIALKEAALNMMHAKNRSRAVVEAELKKMKKAL